MLSPTGILEKATGSTTKTCFQWKSSKWSPHQTISQRNDENYKPFWDVQPGLHLIHPILFHTSDRSNHIAVGPVRPSFHSYNIIHDLIKNQEQWETSNTPAIGRQLTDILHRARGYELDSSRTREVRSVSWSSGYGRIIASRQCFSTPPAPWCNGVWH